MKDTHDEPSNGGGGEPEITLVAINDETFYIVQGEEHLNQLLLVDGDYPVPILCIHFKSIVEIKATMGEGINMSNYWTVHPKIIARLRETNVLIERTT